MQFTESIETSREGAFLDHPETLRETTALVFLPAFDKPLFRDWINFNRKINVIYKISSKLWLNDDKSLRGERVLILYGAYRREFGSAFFNEEKRENKQPVVI